MIKSDKQLIKGLKKDDKKSFDELFERYYDQCYAYAIALVKDAAAVEDIIQNVFLKVWLARMRIEASRPFQNYLLASIRNESLSYLRLKFHSSKVSAMPEVADSAPGAINYLTYSEIDSKLSGVVSKMPTQRRRIFEMSRNQELSINEISTKLNLSPRTVERHLYLALKDIRKVIS